MKSIIVLSFVAVLVSCGTEAKKLIPIIDAEEPVSKPLEVYSVPSAGQIDILMGRSVNDHIGLTPDATPDIALSCVDIISEATTLNSNGSEIKISLEHITSTKDLFEKTSTNLSVALAVKGWGKFGGSVSGSHKTMVQRDLKETSSYALITAQKTFVPVNVKEAVMKPMIVEGYKGRGEQLIKGCGTGYVSSITMGARAYGLMECTTNSVEQKKTMDAVIAAKAGYMAVEASGSFQKTLEEISKATNARCFITVEFAGGVGTLDAAGDKFASSVIRYVESATRDSAVPVSYATKPYGTLLVGTREIEELKNAQAASVLNMQDYIDTKKIVFNYALAKMEKAKATAAYGPLSDTAKKVIIDNQVLAHDISRDMLNCALNFKCTEEGDW